MTETLCYVKILGFLGNRYSLAGTMTGEELQEGKKSINPLSDLLNDISYRIEIGEGLNLSDFSQAENDSEFEDFVWKYLEKAVELKMVEIKEVCFEEYWEDGRFEGYDYSATLAFDYESLWEKYKALS